MAPRRNPKPAPQNALGTLVALLRGINVGGKNKLPMRELVAMFTDAGCTNVQTYIQSGNVVFSAGAGLAKRIPTLIPGRIAESFGYRIPIILRTAVELQQVEAGNPFVMPSVDTKSLHVGFLADLPAPRDVKALDPNRSPGDSFRVLGREIYLNCPNGVARSKLTNAYFDSTLGTTSTFRNWRTIEKLLELTNPTD